MLTVMITGRQSWPGGLSSEKMRPISAVKCLYRFKSKNYVFKGSSSYSSQWVGYQVQTGANTNTASYPAYKIKISQPVKEIFLQNTRLADLAGSGVTLIELCHQW